MSKADPRPTTRGSAAERADDAREASRGGFPRLSPGILWATTADGGVVYDLVDERLSFLNHAGIALVAACAEGADRSLAPAGWAESADVSIDRVRADIDTALAAFGDAGFVGRADPAPRTFPPDAPVGTPDDGEAMTVQAAGVHSIRFRGHDAALIAAVRERLGMTSDGEPTVEFRIVGDPDGTIRLITDTEWRFSGAEELLDRLVTVVNDFVARTTTELVLHAAALVSPRGSTVVFPAAPGSGKSTLAGSLVARGWGYLADESATIRTGDLAVIRCAKPIGLDEASCVALGLDPGVAGDVPLGAIAAHVRRVDDPVPPPSAVVVPSYVGPEGTPSVASLDFDAALVTLVGNVLNLRYVGSPGLQTIVELAARTPVHTIAYRDSAEAHHLLADLGFDSRSPGA